MNPEKKVILEKIGHYFLTLNNNDFKKTRDLLQSMQITQVEVLSNTKIMIMLRRPGLLIGKKGQTIEGLQKHLETNIQIVEDTEESLYDYLIPYEWSDLYRKAKT